MIVRCLQCGTEQEMRTGVPASKNIPREQGVSVCVNCGGIWAEYVSTDMSGIVLGDGKRYLRGRDFPADHPVQKIIVKHYVDGGSMRWPVSEDPDLLVARA